MIVKRSKSLLKSVASHTCQGEVLRKQSNSDRVPMSNWARVALSTWDCVHEIILSTPGYSPSQHPAHAHTHEFVDVWSDFVTNSNSWTRNPIIFCTLARKCWICSNMIWWLLLAASNMFQNDCMYKQQGRSQACRSRCPENGWLFVGLLKWLSSLCPGTVCIKTQLGQAITESGRYTLCDVDALTTLRPRSNTSQMRKNAKGKGKEMVITMIIDW